MIQYVLVILASNITGSAVITPPINGPRACEAAAELLLSSTSRVEKAICISLGDPNPAPGRSTQTYFDLPDNLPPLTDAQGDWHYPHSMRALIVPPPNETAPESPAPPDAGR